MTAGTGEEPLEDEMAGADEDVDDADLDDDDLDDEDDDDEDDDDEDDDDEDDDDFDDFDDDEEDEDDDADLDDEDDDDEGDDGYEPGDANALGSGDYEAGDVNTIDAAPPVARERAAQEATQGGGGTPAAVLTYLAQSMADDPDAVVIRQEDRRGTSVLRLHVAPGDMGRVIGRRGRTAQAIRTLVAAAGARDGVQVAVDIVDD